jgi:hypothetical protein
MKKRQAQKSEPRDMSASAHEIADHVTAILNHPDTPEALTDGILRAFQDLDDNADVHKQVGYVEAILVTHFEDEKGGAR